MISTVYGYTVYPGKLKVNRFSIISLEISSLNAFIEFGHESYGLIQIKVYKGFSCHLRALDGKIISLIFQQFA